MNSHTKNRTNSIKVVVIGAGQSGLAVGYYLAKYNIPFVIVDGHKRIGDSWRNRWDSLRVFTPARYSGLAGMPFPKPSWSYPTKAEVADYLESYAARFELPVRTGIKIDKLLFTNNRFELILNKERLQAENVVVATGAYHHPRIPEFAGALDGSIFQMHSFEYRRPSQLQDGGVLVVGAGNSGSEIALELSKEHQVWLSGPDTGQEPVAAGTFAHRFFVPVMWFMASEVLKVNNPVGRKVRDHFLKPPKGIPLGRVRQNDLVAAGIERVPRTVGVRDGYPLLANDRVQAVKNVIWCTGFAPDFSWIDFPIFDDYGWPVQNRGVVKSQPGLFFMGMLFQYALSSALIGGVSRDAKYLARHIKARSFGQKRNLKP